MYLMRVTSLSLSKARKIPGSWTIVTKRRCKRIIKRPSHVYGYKDSLLPLLIFTIKRGSLPALGRYRPSPTELLRDLKPHIVVGTPQIISKMTEEQEEKQSVKKGKSPSPPLNLSTVR